MKCCICGKEIKDYGNNPFPIAENGECCDNCNMEVVVPARINLIKPNDNQNH